MTVTITGSSGIETAQTGDSDITLDAGTGSEAGNQASTINMKLNGTLKGDISVDESRSGNPLELNTTSTGDVVLAMGGGNVGIGAAAPGEKLTVVGDMSVDTDTLYVDAANNLVGIGTTLPEAKLEIEDGGTSKSVLLKVTADDSSPYAMVIGNDTFSTSDTDGLAINVSNSGDAIINARGTGSTLSFRTVGSERARIDSSGNLLVGKTVATEYPEGIWIDGANGRFFATSGDTYAAQFTRNGTDGVLIYFYNDTAQAGTISISGSSTSYNTSSDYRLKENVVDLDGAIDRVKQVPVHRFNFISKPDKTVDGFLAHEVSDIVPEAVHGEKDAMKTEEYEVTPEVLDDDGNVVTEAVMGTREVPEYQGIDQSKLVPLLTAALKEAIEEIEALKVRVAALEA